MIKESISSYLSDFVSLFYPNLCVGCDETLPKGSDYLCPKCHYNLPKTRTHELEVPQFSEKFQGVIPIQHILIYLHFYKKGVTQKVLHQLKYGNQPQIGELIGKWYGYDLLEAGFENSFDLVVPVPIHKKRLKQRGYNQSEHFGIGIAEVLNITINTADLVKTKHVSSQTRKVKLDRIKNVENVFEVINPNTFEDKNLLLVDDLLTTGSTLIGCAEVLLKCKPKSISIATIGGAK